MRPRAIMILCITIANAKPMTSSTPTVITMMSTVFQVSRQNSWSVRMVP